MAKNNSVSVANVQIDTTSLKKLAADLRAMDPEAAANLRTGLKAAGLLLVEEAKVRSAWSQRIPGSIRATTSGVSLSVKAGGKKAPEAAALENHGQSGTFRHPLNFPNQGVKQNWVTQQARPFLGPALDATASAVEDAVVDALETGFKALGLDLA